MIGASPEVQRERAVRARRNRVRSRAVAVVQVGWVTIYLVGGGVALAEGDRPAALIGLTVGAIFALLTIMTALRRRRLKRQSWPGS